MVTITLLTFFHHFQKSKWTFLGRKNRENNGHFTKVIQIHPFRGHQIKKMSILELCLDSKFWLFFFLKLLLFVNPLPSIGSSDHLQKKKPPTCVHNAMWFFKLVKMAIEFLSIFSEFNHFKGEICLDMNGSVSIPFYHQVKVKLPSSLHSHNSSTELIGNVIGSWLGRMYN